MRFFYLYTLSYFGSYYRKEILTGIMGVKWIITGIRQHVTGNREGTLDIYDYRSDA